MTAKPCALPATSQLAAYRESGAYTDCYCIDLPGAVSLAGYIEAFYTTRVFKLERLVLRWLVARPSTDAQARQLEDAAAAGDAARCPVGWQRLVPHLMATPA